MTTPPTDPTQPGGFPPYGLPPYGAPQDPTVPPQSPYEGATNGFGGPFVPTPEQLAPPSYPAQAGQPAAPPFPPYQSPYGSPAGPSAPNPPPYGQPPYGQQPPGYGQYGSVQGQPYFPQSMPAQKNGLAVAGMVLGIVSIPFAIGSFFDIPVVIVGFILSVVALNRAKRSGVGATMAKWGIALSLIGAVAATAMSIYVVQTINDCSRTADIGTSAFEECIQNRTGN